MKGDDDTFVRVDAVLNEARNVPDFMSAYIGNINYHHKPLRHGKWAVTYEVIRICCNVFRLLKSMSYYCFITFNLIPVAIFVFANIDFHWLPSVFRSGQKKITRHMLMARVIFFPMILLTTLFLNLRSIN